MSTSVRRRTGSARSGFPDGCHAGLPTPEHPLTSSRLLSPESDSESKPCALTAADNEGRPVRRPTDLNDVICRLFEAGKDRVLRTMRQPNRPRRTNSRHHLILWRQTAPAPQGGSHRRALRRPDSEPLKRRSAARCRVSCGRRRPALLARAHPAGWCNGTPGT
jgi:hypothetical protein